MTLQYTEDETKAKVDSITVYGTTIPGDLLYDNVPIAIVKLPLDPSSGSQEFVIRQGHLNDTITISYSSEAKFLSNACGYTFYYSISGIVSTNNSIDNILIIDSDVNPGDNENLRTFF